MKVVLHAGLHKSATTSVQHQWRTAYSQAGQVWYPTKPGMNLPGHHPFIWPLLEAFRNQEAPDLVWPSTVDTKLYNLQEVLNEAVSRNVGTLLISTEELDRLEIDDSQRLRELLEPFEVISVLTVTNPVHRWCSGWQELVKHGLADYPAAAAKHILTFASLQSGRLEELANLLPGKRCIIRLVRTHPSEENLPRSLAQLLDLEWPTGLTEGTSRNRSLGINVEILRRLNAAEMACGVQSHGTAQLKRLTSENLEYTAIPGLQEAYEFPESFWRAAKVEAEFLRNPTHGIEVIDPHNEMVGWLTGEPPQWYAEISRGEAKLPSLHPKWDTAEALWRARVERAALRKNLSNHQKRIKDLMNADPVEPAPIILPTRREPFRSKVRLRRVSSRRTNMVKPVMLTLSRFLYTKRNAVKRALRI